MPTLPVTGATELVSAQAVPEEAVNEMGRYLDANVSRSTVEDRDLATPPGSCADGARYLVAASPTDAWTGKAGKLAIAVGTDASNGWLFQTYEKEGFQLYIRDENIEIMWNGSAWVQSATAFSVPQEWGPNFTSDSSLYIPASEAMTIDQGNAAIGTGSLAYEKSTTADPDTFSSTSLPATLQAGAWLKVTASGVTEFLAAHLVRTA